MGDAVVTLTSSDSEEDVFVKNGLQSVETDLHYGRRNSDDEYKNIPLFNTCVSLYALFFKD